jgi:hypothetical protein
MLVMWSGSFRYFDTTHLWDEAIVQGVDGILTCCSSRLVLLFLGLSFHHIHWVCRFSTSIESIPILFCQCTNPT